MIWNPLKGFYYKYVIVSCFFFFQVQLFAQISNNFENTSNDAFQVGGALSLTFEVQKFTNYRLALTGGIGKRINQAQFLYPTLHTELQFYQGGMGSSLSSLKRQHINVDWIISFMVLAGTKDVENHEFLERFNPINFFADDSSAPLHNPFYHSIGIGTNFIRSTDNFKKNQYLGVLNVNINRVFQFNYYNDGTPFHWMGLGDGFDRYYTGGGFVAVYLDHESDIDFIQLSYNKFTGYQQYAFEAANYLQIDFLPYKDPESFYFNQSRWRGKIGNFSKGFSFTVSGYDLQKGDGQDLIHYIIDNSYHPDPYREARWGLGLNYSYINYNSL